MNCPSLEIPNSVSTEDLHYTIHPSHGDGNEVVVAGGTERHMGAVRQFSCSDGFYRIGPENTTCLPSGLPR